MAEKKKYFLDKKVLFPGYEYPNMDCNIPSQNNFRHVSIDFAWPIAVQCKMHSPRKNKRQ